MATHSSLLAWRIPAQRGLAGYSPWGHTESDTTERLSTHLLLQTQLAIAGLLYFPKQFYLKLYQPDLNTNDNATKWPLTDIRCTRGQSYMKIMCVLVAQLCPKLCDPMDCSPPGSSVHGILQAGILEWVAISFSGGSSQPRDQTQVSCTAGEFFTI